MSANVALSDTFDQWRVKNNELMVMTQTDGSDNFIKLTNTTNSTSNTTGSIISTGGLGITKSAVIGGNLNVHGNIHANGAITADGSITLGDTDADNIVFNADINSSIVPNTNGSFDIGNTSMYWSNGFFEHIKLSANSTLGLPTLEIDADDEDQAAFTIDGEQTTIATMRIDADVLTTNSAAVFSDDSASTSSRDSVQVLQDNSAALAATALYVQSDGGVTGMQIDKNFTGVAAATVTGLHVDFDRTVPGSGTANFTDIGINLDCNSAGLGTTTQIGLDVDVVGATTGTHTATGIDIAVSGGDTNYALITTGGNVGISTAAPAYGLEVTGTVGITGATTHIGAITVGVDDTGHDVKFFGDTSGNYWLWDTSADGTVQVGDSQLTGALTVGVDDTGHDVKFFGDTSGNYWLWDTSADGTVQVGDSQLTGALTVGVDGTGHNVKFFGDTASQYMLWDQSTDELVLTLDSKLSFWDAAGGENIVSASNGALGINAGTTLTLTAPTITVADGSVDFNIASHDGSNGLKLGGTLVTVTAADINGTTGKSIAMAIVFGG